MHSSRILLRPLAVFVMLSPISVFAQAAPPADATPKSAPASAEITVSADRAAASTSIDRKTYSVSRDLQSTSGSVADILNNLPSVDVDAQGNVSVRGDSNVQILIDGRPSTQFSQTSRGEALQQLPASAIDSIEVITNPTARYKPDGASGIINIITKKNRKPGRSGTAQASVGSDGRFNLAGTQSYTAGQLSLTANVNIRRDNARRQFSDRRTRTDLATGLASSSSQDNLLKSRRTSFIASLGADYDLTPHDKLSGNVSYNDRSGAPQIASHNLTADAAGMVTSDYIRNGIGTEREVTTEASARYVHSFAEKRHQLTLDLRQGQTVENQFRRYTNTYDIPPGLVSINEQQPRISQIQRELTAEYAKPLAHTGQLIVGYDLTEDDNDFYSRSRVVDPASGLSISALETNNRFLYLQTVHALYTTYERSFGGEWSGIFGLRFEQALIDTHQFTINQRNHHSYSRLYPTLHLEKILSDGHVLRFNYSHRIVRPEADDLNPYPEFQDPLNVRAGNPDLRPQETDSFETGYQYSAHGTSLEGTFYLRKNRNVFTDVSRFISPNVLLTTRENLGRSTTFGLEFAGRGKLRPDISYNVSANIFRNEIDASNLGFPGTRSNLSFTAKASADYRITTADVLQVSLNYSGRRLLPQGYRLPSSVVNLGYRHQVRSGLSATFTVTDLFNTQRDRLVLNTPELHDESTRRRSVRTANFALNWVFGGSRKATPETKFDYSEDKS